MNRYASQTAVPEERSRAEIERCLRRFGADRFAYATDEGRRAAMIQFRYRGLSIRMVLALPDPNTSARTPTGRQRRGAAALVDYERERKRRWRALALAIKAKLVAIEEGITSFEQEWLPYLVWGDGRTTGEHLIPRIVPGAELPDSPRGLLSWKDAPRADEDVIDIEAGAEA